MLAYSDAVLITGIVVAFFIVLALITLARVLMRRTPSAPSRFRVGVFVERDHEAGRREEQ